jgi:hypothetical protein
MNTKSKARELTSDEKQRWAFINQWKVEEQGNDRIPMDGAAPNKDGRVVPRSVVRRQHQLNYKRWSQERSD